MKGKFLGILVLLIATFTADASHSAYPILDCDQVRRNDPISCMACNIYWEARDEPHEGKVMVALVTMNRVKDKRFPNDVCRVVWQWAKNKRGKRVAQFSWTKDGRADIVRRKYRKEWEDAVMIAQLALISYKRGWIDLHVPGIDHSGVLWYHADYVNPWWNRRKHIVAKVGLHIFYRETPVDVEVRILPKSGG